MNNNINIHFRREGKWKIVSVTFCILSIILFTICIASVVSVFGNHEINVYYSLDKYDNDKKLIEVIDSANIYVYFAIYFFTKNSIADALIRAKSRGVDVIGIMDRDASLNSNAKILERLKKASIQMLAQRHLDGIMHMKALVTENAYASGSYNWTDSATTMNDEVLEVVTNESVRKRYLAIIKNIITINQ